MDDFLVEATPTSVSLHPISDEARRHAAVIGVGYYAKFYSPNDLAIVFKLPADKRDLDDYKQRLASAGFKIRET